MAVDRTDILGVNADAEDVIQTLSVIFRRDRHEVNAFMEAATASGSTIHQRTLGGTMSIAPVSFSADKIRFLTNSGGSQTYATMAGNHASSDAYFYLKADTNDTILVKELRIFFTTTSELEGSHLIPGAAVTDGIVVRHLETYNDNSSTVLTDLSVGALTTLEVACRVCTSVDVVKFGDRYTYTLSWATDIRLQDSQGIAVIVRDDMSTLAQMGATARYEVLIDN
jgi:hypothetical protein